MVDYLSLKERRGENREMASKRTWSTYIVQKRIFLWLFAKLWKELGLYRIFLFKVMQHRKREEADSVAW